MPSPMDDGLTVSGRVTGLVLALLGLLWLAVASVVPFTAGAPLLAFVLMSVPAAFGGIVALVHGTAVLSARLRTTDNQLELAAPGWRAFPVPPVRKLTVRWDEIRAVRRRTEVYRILGMVPFPVEVFAVETAKGTVVLGGSSIPGMRRALQQVAERAGLRVQDAGVIEAGMMRSLLKGPPPWGC